MGEKHLFCKPPVAKWVGRRMALRLASVWIWAASPFAACHLPLCLLPVYLPLSLIKSKGQKNKWVKAQKRFKKKSTCSVLNTIPYCWEWQNKYPSGILIKTQSCQFVSNNKWKNQSSFLHLFLISIHQSWQPCMSCSTSDGTGLVWPGTAIPTNASILDYYWWHSGDDCARPGLVCIRPKLY